MSEKWVKAFVQKKEKKYEEQKSVDNLWLLCMKKETSKEKRNQYEGTENWLWFDIDVTCHEDMCQNNKGKNVVDKLSILSELTNWKFMVVCSGRMFLCYYYPSNRMTLKVEEEINQSINGDILNWGVIKKKLCWCETFFEADIATNVRLFIVVEKIIKYSHLLIINRVWVNDFPA